jgi:hypothetical protein
MVGSPTASDTTVIAVPIPTKPRTAIFICDLTSLFSFQSTTQSDPAHYLEAGRVIATKNTRIGL